MTKRRNQKSFFNKLATPPASHRRGMNTNSRGSYLSAGLTFAILLNIIEAANGHIAYFSDAAKETIYNLQSGMVEEKFNDIISSFNTNCNATLLNATDAIDFQRIHSFSITVYAHAAELYRMVEGKAQQAFEDCIIADADDLIYDYKASSIEWYGVFAILATCGLVNLIRMWPAPANADEPAIQNDFSSEEGDNGGPGGGGGPYHSTDEDEDDEDDNDDDHGDLHRSDPGYNFIFDSLIPPKNERTDSNPHRFFNRPAQATIIDIDICLAEDERKPAGPTII
jgi:hypothetical protein